MLPVKLAVLCLSAYNLKTEREPTSMFHVRHGSAISAVGMVKSENHLNNFTEKLVFGVFDQVQHNKGCTATEVG